MSWNIRQGYMGKIHLTDLICGFYWFLRTEMCAFKRTYKAECLSFKGLPRDLFKFFTPDNSLIKGGLISFLVMTYLYVRMRKTMFHGKRR